MVPGTGWLMRKRRGVLLAAFVCWAAAILGVLYFMHWFATQPYSVPFAPPNPPLSGAGLRILASSVGLVSEFLCLLLILFPLLIAWLPRVRRCRGLALFVIISVLLSFLWLEWAAKWTLPWSLYTLRNEFASSRVGDGSLRHLPFMLGMTASLILSLIVVAAFLAFAAEGLEKSRAQWISWERLSESRTFWLLAPFSLVYCASLWIVSLGWWPFDRYLLVVMPVGIIALILAYQEWVAPNLPAISVATVALFGLLAIAGTHDWFAWQRARLTAISRLRAAGIPRTAIEGGFEYDGWTQLEDGGHLNDPRIKVPPGAYHPAPDTLRLADGCEIEVIPLTPDVQPRYFVAFERTPCLVPSKYGPVHFRTWLPPFHRTDTVEQLPEVKKPTGSQGSSLGQMKTGVSARPATPKTRR